MYKLTESSITRLSDGASIPQAEGNRDYQQFLQDVKSKGISIVEGEDVIAPDYVALRTGVDGYASTGDQLGMIADGTQKAHVDAVKVLFPKTITGGTTVATVPDWVKTEADALLFREQLQAYTIAVARLDKYILADGLPEVTEMLPTGEQVFNEDTMEMEDVLASTITQVFIEALEATVEVTTYSDDMDAEPTVETIENPLITQDNLERVDAQAVVKATPAKVVTKAQETI